MYKSGTLLLRVIQLVQEWHATTKSYTLIYPLVSIAVSCCSRRLWCISRLQVRLHEASGALGGFVHTEVLAATFSDKVGRRSVSIHPHEAGPFSRTVPKIGDQHRSGRSAAPILAKICCGHGAALVCAVMGAGVDVGVAGYY